MIPAKTALCIAAVNNPLALWCRNVFTLVAGLFSRVAAMSGSTLGPWAIQAEPLKFARRLAHSLDCNKTSSAELVDCLRAVDASDIMKVNSKIYGKV